MPLCEMASQLKYKIAKNIYDIIQNKAETFNDFLGHLNLIRSKENHIIWKVTLPSQFDSSLDTDFILKSQKELVGEKTVKSVKFENTFNTNYLEVKLNVKDFIKDILDSDPTKINYKLPPNKLIVEFSSPNIAKPFHVGHVRSTVIGNCLANVKKKLGNDVVKMNYLGDWGTQFGMIQLGMNLGNYSVENLKKNPLEVLFKAYVKGNAEAEKDLELYKQAKKIFCDLESEKEDITQLWNKYRNWTLEELKAVYSRLGISFDEYSWESDYKRIKVDKVLKMLEEKGILSEDEKGRKVAVVGNKKFPLLKSDDTTLYLSRDLVAVMDRRSKHSFDEMYYVVENGQSEHFQALLTLCSELNLDEGVILKHVKFGRVHGMSTRKGKIIFLSDVINEAAERIFEKQVESKNTKAPLDNKEVADILGVSAVIINDLRQSRLKDYEFSWDSIIRLKGDTGISMQYCLSRLSNLEQESGCTAASDCDPEALLEPEAVNLISAIARYEESLWRLNALLEPCALVSYVCDLVRAANVAYKQLNVKGSDSHVASQRLLMFKKSKDVLHESLTLLGIKPLSKM